MDDAGEAVASLYERHAHPFDRSRGRSLLERGWLDHFLAAVGGERSVLDLGCGAGEPLACYPAASGCAVTGVDSAPSLIGRCRTRFPAQQWLVADMRCLALGRTFGGILACDRFFHLQPDDKRAMFGVFTAHARKGTALMFTSGPARGEVLGTFEGEPLYHASLDGAEYEARLAAAGFRVLDHVVDDPFCSGHTVWLAAR